MPPLLLSSLLELLSHSFLDLWGWGGVGEVAVRLQNTDRSTALSDFDNDSNRMSVMFNAYMWTLKVKAVN